MSRDDRDIESSNPSKSFKVGDFDRLSGFFTPVWESKRRIRSESPIPASGPASSKSGAGKPATKPTPSKGVAATKPTPAKVAAVASTTEAPAVAVEKAPGEATSAPPPEATEQKSPPAAASQPALPDVAAAPAPVDATGPSSPAPVAAAPATAGSRAAPNLSKAPKEAPRPAQAPRRAPEPAAPVVANAPAAPTTLAAAAAAKRGSSQATSATAPTKARAPRPSLEALEQAGPNLPAAAFLDPKPDFRGPLSKSTPAPLAERSNTLNQRSLRASVAATRLHEQLRARAPADSFEAPELQWGTETDRELTAASPAAAEVNASPSDDPHPLHLLRRLRRTIHLSTPLPESVREMIARYGRN